MIYTIFFLALLVCVYVIGRALKRNLLPEIIIGLLVGLTWEIYSAHEWIYDSSKLVMINLWIETIPLDVVIAWGASLAATMLLVYEIMKLLKARNKFSFLIIGWLALFIVGLCIELVGYYGGFWGYTVKSNLFFWPTKLPLRIVVGWVTLGTFNIATIKLYRDDLEKEINSLIKTIKHDLWLKL